MLALEADDEWEMKAAEVLILRFQPSLNLSRFGILEVERLGKS